MVVEAVMYMEREKIARPDYRPYRSEVCKWASPAGLVFIGDCKVKLEHPPPASWSRGGDGTEDVGEAQGEEKVFRGAFGAGALGFGRSEVSRDVSGGGWGLWGVGHVGLSRPH